MLPAENHRDLSLRSGKLLVMSAHSFAPVGKQENCRVAVSLSVSTREVSLPIAWRLYLPEVWAHDKKRRKATGIPPEISFQTKPEIALQQIRTALDRKIPSAPVLTEAGYGN